nr:MAG TPA: hypothetical protein [Caudoviricetes sp.]
MYLKRKFSFFLIFFSFGGTQSFSGCVFLFQKEIFSGKVLQFLISVI